MYIKRVVLENVRGFENLDFDFERADGRFAGWTVITGDNASGKTTLLKAMAAALVGPDAVRSLQASWKGWIRRGAKDAAIAVEVCTDKDDRFEHGRPYEKPFWSELKLAANGGPEISIAPGKKYVGKGKGPTHGPWAENPAGWFCVGYGPFRRLYGASQDAQRIMSGPSRVARFATMFREDATLGECELWLKELHHRGLEDRPRETTLLDEVKRVLDSDFLQNGLHVDHVDSEGLWLGHPNGVVLPLSEMSEGYRAAIAMLVDILRHVANVYDQTGLLQYSEGQPVVERSGIVLIDEVDSHLHPQWQQNLGFWLKKILPKMQFIVTSHSPIICQAADDRGIFHLPAPGTQMLPFQVTHEDYGRIVRGKLDEVYLSPAFGLENTRSPRAVEARKTHARLRSKKAVAPLTDEEKKEYLSAEWFLEPEPVSEGA